MTDRQTTPSLRIAGSEFEFWGGVVMGAAGTLAAAVASGPLVFGLRLGF